jgi:hypothetical protein
MRARADFVARLALAFACAAPAARATGFSDYGQDLSAEPESSVSLDGYFRVRGALLYNLALDRGPTPSGQLLYPVPLSDPDGQTLSAADMRLRTDLAVYAPGGGMAVKVRVDWLDNIALGSAPEGVPSASSSQRPASAVSVKRAYGESTPLERCRGTHGQPLGSRHAHQQYDCADCGGGDAANRLPS